MLHGSPVFHMSKSEVHERIKTSRVYVVSASRVSRQKSSYLYFFLRQPYVLHSTYSNLILHNPSYSIFITYVYHIQGQIMKIPRGLVSGLGTMLRYGKSMS
jgi:hypothetical protein